jgi:predicted N-formylglutamate amidohydrolase
MIQSLLLSSEPAAFELVNARGESDIVLVCDHASKRIPLHLNSLGLTAQQLSTHIGWDIGALQLARCLSAQLDAPLVFTNYSRLVVDCNRLPERSDLIPASSDGVIIPGNQNISVQENLIRRQCLFDPYHAAIDRLLQTRADRRSLLLSIHSFTPTLQTDKRPWPIGVCYHKDNPWSKRWLTALQSQLATPVGDNEPYSVEPEVDFTIPVHGLKHDLPAIMLEIRQDGLGNHVATKQWSNIIAAAWRQIASLQVSLWQ